MGKPVFGYWNIRGLGQYVRLILEYGGVDYEEKRYDIFNNPEEWAKAKPNLGLDFPNLPYYIDGDVKLSQSMATLRYLGRKHAPAKNNEEQTRADVACEQIRDLKFSFAMLCYGADYEEKKQAFIETLPQKLEQVDAYLGDNKWFGGGDSPTYVDFYAYDVLDGFRVFDLRSLSKCAKISAFFARFEALPSIQKYMKSDRFISSPIFTPAAKWTG